MINNFFKKIFLLLISLFLFSQIQLIGNTRIVRIGVFPAAPLVMVKDNKPEGLFIDLIEYFSVKLNWDVKYVEGKWGDLLVSLEKGEIDLLPAVGYNEKRLSIYDFSKNPVYIDSGVLFCSPKLALNTIFDLQGKCVAALRGSIFTTGFIDYINSFGIKCDMIYTDTNQAVMEAISKREVDAGVCIYSLGNELARDYSVVITPINFSPVSLHFAVPKGKNSDLIAGIDKLMIPLISETDSLYHKSFHKWTMRNTSVELPKWFWWGIIGILAFGLFLVLWNFILKNQIAVKTKHLELEILEHKELEKKIKQSLSEKETLIRELYHRTKNTLQ
ncbi:MAG TPA: transporter substrate-binding domain-containing protein, partial [Spirochaetota bacterium]|nr:transporter substrate-binding domain-containing protein [Spirochaetota bacterium]